MAAAPGAPEPRRRRWPRRVAAGATVVAVLMAAVLGIVHVPQVRRMATDRLVSFLAARGIEVSLSELDYNLLRMRVSAGPLRVRRLDAPDLPPFVEITRLEADMSLLGLLRGRYEVEQARVSGLVLQYVVDGAGRDNLPRFGGAAAEGGEPTSYRLDDVEVHGARVRYEHRGEGVSVETTGLAVTVDAAPRERHDLTVSTSQVSVVAAERTVALTTARAEVDLGRDDLRVSSLRLAGAGATLDATGSLSDFDTPRVAVEGRVTADLAEVSRVVRLADPLTGRLEARVTAQGPARSLVIGADASASDVAFRTLNRIALTSDLSYDVGTRRLDLRALELTAPFGEMSASGALAPDGELSRLTASIAGLRVATLLRAVDTDVSVRTTADAAVDVTWSGREIRRATGTADIGLAYDRTRTSLPPGLPIAGRVGVRAENGAARVALQRVRTDGVSVDGRLTLSLDEALGGTATVRVPDIARAVQTVAMATGRPVPDIAARVSGTASAALRLGGTLRDPRVAAHLAAPQLALGEARGATLVADLVYRPARVELPAVALQWQGARLTAAGAIGLRGARPLALALHADALRVETLLTAAGSDVPAAGLVSAEARIGGSIEQPDVVARLTAADLLAYGEPWGLLTADARVRGRRVDVSAFTLDKPQPGGAGRIEGQGMYDLTSRQFSMDVRSRDVRLTGLTLPGGQAVRGGLALEAEGRGTLDDPQAAFSVEADDFRVDDRLIGPLRAGGTVADASAGVTLEAPRFGTTADARIGIRAPYPTTADVRVERLALEALPLGMGAPVTGTLDAAAHVSAALARPRDADATVRLSALEGTYNGQPFRLTGASEIRYAAERLTIDVLQLAAGDAAVTLRGDLPLAAMQPPGTIEIAARADLASAARYIPTSEPLQAAGTVVLMGVVRGTLQSIDPRLTLAVSDASIAAGPDQPAITDLNLQASVEDGVLRLRQLEGRVAGGTIDAVAEVPLDILPPLPVEVPRPGGAATITAHARQLDLSRVPGVPDRLRGQLGLTADVRAPRAALDAMEGMVVFDALTLAFDELTLAQDAPTAIQLDGGVARVARLSLGGSVGQLTGSGTVGLTGNRAVAVDVSGDLNVGVVSLFTDVLRADGKAALDIAARGTVTAPTFDGAVVLQDASFVVDEPTVAVESVAARIDLQGRRATLSQLSGTLNGGSLDAGGFVEFGPGGIADAALDVTATDVANDFPLDLRSLSTTTLRLERDEAGGFVLRGRVLVDEAGLTGDVNFDEGLLAAMHARRRLDLTEERNTFLERLRFDVEVDTATPILVENNLARAEVTTDLRVIGTRYEPGLAGQLTLLEGGEVRLNERRYEIERGVITFVGEREITPSFDLLLHTTAQNYDITLAVTGTPGDTETSLTADPTLPEPDIMALLVTGRTLDEMRGEEFEVAREQVLSYLAGRVGSQLGRGLQEATGLSRVSIEPNLIANETDPSARLTLGQQLTPRLELVYSVDLTDSNDQIWVAQYDVTRRFQSTVVRQSDATYRGEFRHDLRFGGRPAPGRVLRTRPRVAAIRVENGSGLPEEDVRRLLGVRVGEEFDFMAAREGTDRVRDALAGEGRLESRVRLTRQGTDALSVLLTVSAGPRVDIRFLGATPPRDIARQVRTQWQRGVFDTQRVSDGVETLRGWLMASQHLQATVMGEVRDLAPDVREVRFVMQPGPRSRRMVLTFAGAMGIDPDELRTIIAQQDLELELFSDPIQVTTLLERYYHEQGYLIATVDEPTYDFVGMEARVVLTVKEGPRFVVRRMTASGNRVISEGELVGDLPLVPGLPFLPFAAENALEVVRDRYWSRGYNDAHADFTLALDRQAGVVDVAFTVEEGAAWVVDTIEVQGPQRTDETMAREQLELAPGDRLDLRALARSRSNLYDTRAYSLVDVAREPQAPLNGIRPVQLVVSLREVQPVQFRYGGSYDTERGFGGVADVSGHNLFGGARAAGLRARVDGQLRDVRGYYSQPLLRGLPIQTTASIYYRDETNPPTELTRRFDISRRGVSIQQERRLRNAYLWTYGYRYERAHSLDPVAGGILDERVTVAPVSSTFTRETRDEPLDATRGSFSAHAFQYSPSWLGADQAYVRYFGQYFTYRALEPTRRAPLTGELLRPRFVLAAGVRAGLARSLGGILPVSERFFAGGSNSLRGFAQNAVGPIGADRLPVGGEAMLVVNGEVRFPLFRIFDGVGFLDVGNVFARVVDIDLGGLRKAAGVGVRIRTPWFLGRLDYGVPLDRRPGEARSRLYFSIGQAF